MPALKYEIEHRKKRILVNWENKTREKKINCDILYGERRIFNEHHRVVVRVKHDCVATVSFKLKIMSLISSLTARRFNIQYTYMCVYEFSWNRYNILVLIMRLFVKKLKKHTKWLFSYEAGSPGLYCWVKNCF